MENNQKLKIDKIFKNSLENQQIVPPLDAWTAIHTYTIGQEESKKKVWFRYVSLAMTLLLVSGLGLWYFVDNQKVIFMNTSVSLSQKVVRRDTDHNRMTQTTAQITTLKNAGRVLNPASVKKIDQITPKPKTKILKLIPVFSEKMLSYNDLSEIQKKKIEPLIIQIKEDSTVNINTEYVEFTSYLKENEIREIEHKPLILNNLFNKIEEKNEHKIVALGNEESDKKDVYKVDSVDYGSKFSLRHPIVNYGVGMLWNFWDVERQMPLNGLIELPNRNGRGAILKFGMAWKVNKKLRMGISMGINGLDAGIPSTSIPLPIYSASAGKQPIIELISVNSDQFYQAETPFGNVNIPVSVFKDVPTFKPNKLDEQKQLYYTDSHQIGTTQFSINSQYDILSKNRKKGKYYGYQLYGLLDCNIQRQISYNYTATTQYLIWVERQWEQRFLDINVDSNHLQNASEFIFGLRAGLGFRYQFARKWDFFVEGSGQHSLNNWVKSDDVKTFQRALSLQAGINLNL